MSSNTFPQVTWVYDGSSGPGDWPSFSADGSQIVFVIGGQSYSLYTINTDGTGLQVLYPDAGAGQGANGSRPDWSWNPSAIAFTQQTNIKTNSAQIWTVAPDGSNPAPYNPSVGYETGLFYPSWAKDYQSLVAVGYTGSGTAVQASLYLVTPDSLTRITESPHPVAGRPTMSPTGNVAFAGNEGQYSQWTNQIWVVHPASGKPPRRIEPGTDLAAIQGRSPNWSPDGKRIVFESTRPNPNPTTSSPLAVWVMAYDGSNPYAVTDINTMSAFHAEWSRQGSQVVFASGGRIGMIDVP